MGTLRLFSILFSINFPLALNRLNESEKLPSSCGKKGRESCKARKRMREAYYHISVGDMLGDVIYIVRLAILSSGPPNTVGI